MSGSSAGPSSSPPSDGAPATKPPERRPDLGSDLKSRLGAGVVLAAAVVCLDWVGLIPFAVLLLAVSIVMSWEWAHIVRGTGTDLTWGVHAASTAAATILAALGLAGLGLAAVTAGAILLFLLQFGEKPLISAAGAVYTGVPAIALLWLRNDEPWGFWAVLFVIAVVAGGVEVSILV